MVIKNFVFNPFQENTYVISDESKKCIIIDAGCLFPYEKEELYNYIKNNDLKVERIINTHLHLDHCFGNPFVLATFNCDIEAHINDEPLCNRMAVQAQMFGIDYKEKQPSIKYIQENDIITVGCISLKVIHVPGHSQGSLAFYCENGNVLFSGDTLFYGSIGRTDLAGGNYEDLIRSITKKLLILPDETDVLCGHGPHTNIKFEKENNPFL